MPELSNYAICYEAIQRVYRNAVIGAARKALEDAYGSGWLKQVEVVFQKEWRDVVDAAHQIRVTGGLHASLTDDFDCLGVNHFHNLFGAFFDQLFPRIPTIGDNVRNEERKAVLRLAKEVNDYRNAMSHPAEMDLPERDAKRLLDSAYRLLFKIDPAVARQIVDYEKNLLPQKQASDLGPPPLSSTERDRTPETTALGRHGIMSARRIAYHEFFTDVLNALKSRDPGFTAARSVGYDNWKTFSVGRTGFSVVAEFMIGPRLLVHFYIDTPSKEANKRAFDQLLRAKSSIEQAIGEELVWDRLDHRRACRIYVQRAGGVDSPPEIVDRLKGFAVDRLLKFKKVFQPIAKRLHLDAP